MDKRAVTTIVSLALFGWGALIGSGCLFLRPPPDPAFANMRVQYESGLKSHVTNVESAIEQFEGTLVGLTPSQKESPKYKSVMGRYEVLEKQFDRARFKVKELLEWALKTEPSATVDDRNKLASEATALNLELTNLGSTAHGLSPEVNVIQMTTR